MLPKENRKMAKRLTILGAIIVIFAGSGLHFLFAATGDFAPVALIAAVNESVWEHLKLAFWPTLIWALISYPYLKKTVANFWAAQTINLYLAPVIIVAFFYFYQAVFHSDNLAYDIGSFAVAVAIGQLASYYYYSTVKPTTICRILTGVTLALIIAAFSLFTYFPPRVFLFRDYVTSGFGIITDQSSKIPS